MTVAEALPAASGTFVIGRGRETLWIIDVLPGRMEMRPIVRYPAQHYGRAPLNRHPSCRCCRL